MILILAFLFILIACYALYLVSSKQINKTQKSKFSALAKHIQWVRFTAFALIILATCIFYLKYGTSISIVAICILSTPILFVLILSVNDLKPKAKK